MKTTLCLTGALFAGSGLIAFAGATLPLLMGDVPYAAHARFCRHVSLTGASSGTGCAALSTDEADCPSLALRQGAGDRASGQDPRQAEGIAV